MAFFLAIDNGSQSTKVMVVDDHGRVHASARVGLRGYDTGVPGRAVHPDDDIWTSIVAACREVLQRFDEPAERISAVGLCTIRYCRALLHADGRLAEPVMSWMDARVGRPYAPVDSVAWVTTSSGYVAHRLTGRFVDASGNYQGVWPIDQHTWRWSHTAGDYARTGMTRDLLFDLVDPGGWLGDITRDAAAATGLAAGTPVFATSNDKAVEALGAGLSEPGRLLVSLGTYVASMTPTDDTTPGAAHWVNFAATPGRYLAESHGIRRGMWTASWFRSLVAGGRQDTGDRMYELDATLSGEAERVPLGSDGVTAVLDWLAPPEAPYRRGALLGFTGDQGRAHIYRAILEAMVFTVADHADAMAEELGRTVETVTVTGGGARSPLLVQLAADVFGLPVSRARCDDAAGMGAAICAAVGSGAFAGWDAAIDRMAGTHPAARPRADAAAIRRLRDRHRGIRRRVAELSRWADQT